MALHSGRDPETLCGIAATNIRRFCHWQMPREWRKSSTGGELGQIVRPLDSVGCYVPGGRYPLPSTLLMTVIPAQVAGVPRICVVSPQPAAGDAGGRTFAGHSRSLSLRRSAGRRRLAYGTETIARVDKIVGPGNSFVTAAKKLVSFDCAIDMLAGPTEAAFYQRLRKSAISCRRHGCAGRARSRGGGRLHHDEKQSRPAGEDFSGEGCRK